MTIFTKSGDKKKSKTVNVISCHWDFCLLVCYLVCYLFAGVRNSDWLISNDAITLGACFSIFVRARFHFAVIGGNLTAPSTGSHKGIGGGIQIPET